MMMGAPMGGMQNEGQGGDDRRQMLARMLSGMGGVDPAAYRTPMGSMVGAGSQAIRQLAALYGQGMPMAQMRKGAPPAQLGVTSMQMLPDQSNAITPEMLTGLFAGPR